MITKELREEQLSLLKKMQDESIDFSDDKDITEDEASLIRPNHLFYKPIKSRVNFTLDKDIITWLRKHKNASNYLNNLLRNDMLKHPEVV